MFPNFMNAQRLTRFLESNAISNGWEKIIPSVYILLPGPGGPKRR